MQSLTLTSYINMQCNCTSNKAESPDKNCISIFFLVVVVASPRYSQFVYCLQNWVRTIKTTTPDFLIKMTHQTKQGNIVPAVSRTVVVMISTRCQQNGSWCQHIRCSFSKWKLLTLYEKKNCRPTKIRHRWFGRSRTKQNAWNRFSGVAKSHSNTPQNGFQTCTRRLSRFWCFLHTLTQWTDGTQSTVAAVRYSMAEYLFLNNAKSVTCTFGIEHTDGWLRAV